MKANCVVCGKEFDKRGNQNSCGIKCSRENRCIREVPGPLLINCIVCGKQFRRSRTKKTCGNQCSESNKRELERVSRIANPSRMAERKRRYRNAHPERCRSALLAWKKENRDRIREYDREQYWKNPGIYRCRAKQWHYFYRASKELGVPPLALAAMKLKDRLVETQENPNADRSETV